MDRKYRDRSPVCDPQALRSHFPLIYIIVKHMNRPCVYKERRMNMQSTDTLLELDKMNLFHVIQPIMNVKQNVVMGYEFLLRSLQCQNPELLFRHAHQQNQLIDLDMKSIFQIFDTIGRHHPLEGITYFINIYPSTLMNVHFLHKMEEYLSNSNINPSSIVFELNEGERNTDYALLKNTIAQYKKIGFLIALDDYGKGESGLISFLEVEPSIMKVDLYFTKNLSRSTERQKIILHLLRLCDKDVTLVLEGIETEEDLRTAKYLGVSFSQGYYLGRPQPLPYYIPEIL